MRDILLWFIFLSLMSSCSAIMHIDQSLNIIAKQHQANQQENEP